MQSARTIGRRHPRYGDNRKLAEQRVTARDLGALLPLKTPIWYARPARAFPGHVAVGIDARDGKVATKGWAEETNVMVTDLAKSFEDAGVAAIIYTDINRDGRDAGAQCTGDS
jgi:phosphoribosylformimino-5-aminoimidazole carboxamide ribotide isomerase